VELTTFQALAVLVIGLLPGALYVWAFERQVGRWGISLSDRVLRFLGTSVLFHTLAAPLTYWLWAEYVVSGRLARGEPLSLWMWLVPVGYAAVPLGLGTLVGEATKRGWAWARLVVGAHPAPRAWDYFFGMEPEGWVRLRLKSDVWVGGALGELEDQRSYAAGYPEEQDLYLVETVEVDPDNGEFVYGEDGRPRLRGSSLLLRWAEVEYLEFIAG
jgi:hypothetical protein